MPTDAPRTIAKIDFAGLVMRRYTPSPDWLEKLERIAVERIRPRFDDRIDGSS
jgi:hypothetical protein